MMIYRPLRWQFDVKAKKSSGTLTKLVDEEKEVRLDKDSSQIG